MDNKKKSLIILICWFNFYHIILEIKNDCNNMVIELTISHLLPKS